MNILIVSDKSDVKTYTQVVKSAPNTSVLGAVTIITSDFIAELKEKWHPHTVIIDTSVPTKNVDVKNIITEIKDYYPYMKVIVLTDQDDDFNYQVFAVIKGQISNIEFNDLLKKAQTDIDNIEVYAETNITEELTYEDSPINSNIGKTENLSKIELNDFSDIQIKIPKIKKKKKNININPVVFAIASVAILLVIVVIIICTKSCGRTETTATADEITTYQINDSSTTTHSSTIDELVVSFTDTPTSPEIPEEQPSTSKKADKKDKTSEASKSESKTSESSSTKKQSNDKNNRSADNDQPNTKTNSNNSSSKQSSESVSYNDNRYNNSTTNKPTTNEVDNVKLSYNSKTLQEGDSVTLTATVTPSSAKNKTKSWYTSNGTVASVNNNGKVTAKKVGTAIITCYVDNKKATCTITVKAKPTTTPATEDPVKLSAKSHSIVVGQIINITLNNSSGCSWTISNPSVVQISGGGSNKISIKGIKTGTTNITATNTSTGKTYTCKVTVN